MDTGNLMLADIGTLFSPQAQKRAEKFPLREVEETEKGHWVAFADDGAESFDVQVTFEKGAILQHSCDCGKQDAKGFCPHQLALLLQLSAAKTTTPKAAAKRKVKEDPLTTLLNQIEPDELKLWLNEVLHQQKDLAIAFTNRFGIKPVDFTREDIEQITDAAAKSIVKNKRKIDQSELKKIILLWKEVHEPVMAHYLLNIADPGKTEVLQHLLASVNKWHLSFKIKSTKIDSYRNEIFAKTIQPLYDIENEEIWQTVISAYFRQGFNRDNPAGTNWLIFLSNLVKFETRESRVDFILNAFKQQYMATANPKGTVVTGFFTELVFAAYQSADRLTGCLEWIKPIDYNNTFNLALIDQLLLHDFDAKAGSICQAIIRSNTNAVYNIPYLSRLANLYKKTDQARLKLYPVLLAMLPQAGGMEDYIILKEEYFVHREGDFKKWNSRILNSLAYDMRSNAPAAHLYFGILHHEGMTSKILERLHDSYTAEVALKYFDYLYMHNKHLLLGELSRLATAFNHAEEDEQYYAALAEKVKAHYNDSEIRQVLLKQEGYWKGAFARYYEKNMKEA